MCYLLSAHVPENVWIFHKEYTSLTAAGEDVYLVKNGRCAVREIINWGVEEKKASCAV